MTDEAGPYVSAAETHSGVVVFLGDHAYKLKKPVDLGFLDFRAREDRLAACHREVELNTRWAPDVYLGVVDVHGPDGEPCEHAVLMRRMPADRSLAALVESGTPMGDAVREVARRVAAFHSTAPRSDSISAQGTRDAVRGRWREHLDDLRPFSGTLVEDGLVEEAEHRAEGFLAGREALFDRRIAEGRIVDGHGDLLARDVFVLDDGPRVLDCLDFDDRLRWLDGLDDIGCLAMDLEYRGRVDVAERLLHWYAEFANDPAAASLRHHYQAYRAVMRAKVDCLRHEQGEETAAVDAQRHAELALAHLRAGSVRMVLVGGLPGTGKSTVADGLAGRLGAVMLSSDRLRKELAGRDPEQSSATVDTRELYSAAHTERTYAAVLERAGELLARGESVVLDASWIRAAHRESAGRMAEEASSEFVALQCTAPREVTAQRMRDRTDSVSDADEDVAAAMAAAADPWPEARSVPTTGSVNDTVDHALALLTADRAH